MKRINEIIENHFQENMTDTIVVMNVIQDLLVDHKITLLTYILMAFFMVEKIQQAYIRTNLSEGKTKLIEMNYPYGYLYMICIIFELLSEYLFMDVILFKLFFLILLFIRGYILLVCLFS